MHDISKSTTQAAKRIDPYIHQTPLEHALALSQYTGAKVYMKCENLQHTGSFKVRGALNKLLTLTPEQKQAGVVTASTGNHGAAVAYGLQALKMTGDIFVPKNAAAAKIANVQLYDAPLNYYGTDCMQTELHAIDYAKKHNRTYS